MPDPASCLDGLAREIAADISARYKITPQHAIPLVVKSLQADAQIAAALAKYGQGSVLKRTSAYKTAVNRARKDVYYHLRQYKNAEGSFSDAIRILATLSSNAGSVSRQAMQEAVLAVAKAHVSTAERIPDGADLIEWIKRADPNGRTVIDVGSGVFALMVPASFLETLGCYLALDRDQAAVAAVEGYARFFPPLLISARCWALEDGWDGLADAIPRSGFDLGLLLKIVPVVARQSRELLRVLAATPARTIVATGARGSMTKQQSIERRERSLLRSFAEEFGLEIAGEFTLSTEFGYILRRP